VTRHGSLIERIADPENLRWAFWRAAKGKRSRPDCREFQESLDRRVGELREGLLRGDVPVGNYHYFMVHDPKERRICAASFEERVLHHALMAVCEPVLDRAAIADSYACRPGKGRWQAVERARGHARSHGWFLKMDVRKYFDSVSHEVLGEALRRKFKDPHVLELFGRILASYHTGPGCGLLIGNLTSQHLANYHLDPLDRFIQETLRHGAYVRYMDDFVVWGDSATGLVEVRKQVREFLQTRLALALKPEPVLNRTSQGMDFLGYRVFPGGVGLSRRSRRRLVRRFRTHERCWQKGLWSEEELQRRTTALLSFVRPADCSAFLGRVIRRFGIEAIGLGAVDPRRQLEQLGRELPGGEPQHQHACESQQQHGIPHRPAPSSTRRPEGPPADPASVLSRHAPSVSGKCSAGLPDVSSPSSGVGRTLPATPPDFQNPVP